MGAAVLTAERWELVFQVKRLRARRQGVHAFRDGLGCHEIEPAGVRKAAYSIDV